MTYAQIESSVNGLDLADQLRLVQSLLPRVTAALLAQSNKAQASDAQQAIARIRAAGQRLSDQSPPGSPSIVQELTQSRR